LDLYLRGLKANPATLIWIDHLLYGQPPPGLDTRLTLDLTLQKTADTLLGEHRGALVLLNAGSGEILTLASHPYYDPNQMDTSWLDLVQDPSAPLLNRATLGQYSPGTALGPFLYAYANGQNTLPVIPTNLTYSNSKGTWQCAITPRAAADAGQLIANGCPAVSAAISEKIGAENLAKIFYSLGFYQSPDLSLEMAQSTQMPIRQVDLAGIGQEDLVVTPLQMALAAAVLSNQGNLPTLRLVSAVLTPHQGWVDLPVEPSATTPLAAGVEETVEALAVPETQTWETTAFVQSGSETLTWYIAGTLPQSTGRPLALALLLEEKDAQRAKEIGQELLKSAMGK
jgi:peptidoglycan glycosyltransferase